MVERVDLSEDETDPDLDPNLPALADSSRSDKFDQKRITTKQPESSCRVSRFIERNGNI